MHYASTASPHHPRHTSPEQALAKCLDLTNQQCLADMDQCVNLVQEGYDYYLRHIAFHSTVFWALIQVGWRPDRPMSKPRPIQLRQFVSRLLPEVKARYYKARKELQQHELRSE